VYFDQNRELDPDLLLRRALAPDSDAVIYQDRVIHVASWAARFLFTGEDLNRRVGKLSGGERARVLIAQLMLQPADVLLLDEPTNDLDIPTLEILEESLLEFRGALVLVTHDRYMLDRVSSIVLGFDGLGGIERFADYSQWEAWQESQEDDKERARMPEATADLWTAVDAKQTTATKKKLSYRESRELESMEQRIAEAERELRERQAALQDSAIISDGPRLHSASLQLDEARKTVDQLYTRWTELEHKKG
ncbi:MAG: ATP-binding cassette domain-containing protein, partial [Candidatus Acidiferrum sp.]